MHFIFTLIELWETHAICCYRYDALKQSLKFTAYLANKDKIWQCDELKHFLTSRHLAASS